jgi:hypothetical protein
MKRRPVRCCRKLFGRRPGHYGIPKLGAYPQRTQNRFQLPRGSIRQRSRGAAKGAGLVSRALCRFEKSL